MKTFLSGCLFAVSAFVVAGCHGTDSSTPQVIQTAQARVVQSRQQQVPLILRATGTVHSRETAVISAQVMGRIQQVLVREGDTVRKGQTIVVLDDATLRASVNQAQAGVRTAQGLQTAAEMDAKLAVSTLERYRQLEAQKSVSPQEMDEVTRRAEAAKARLEAVRAQAEAAQAQESGAQTVLGYSHLVAPFSGVVTARMADPGTIAAPGVSLLQVEQAGALQLHATVDESAIAAIHKGMKVKVTVDSAGFQGKEGAISEIVPAADPASHSFLIKIDLPPSSQLRAGTYGTAEIATGVRQAILIPNSAVVSRGSLACVYVLDSRGIGQLRYLTLGAAQGDFVEALSGISAGEKLVDSPSDRDLAGKRIMETQVEAQP
jgi:RND family efflux transporter MFP subunit